MICKRYLIHDMAWHEASATVLYQKTCVADTTFSAVDTQVRAQIYGEVRYLIGDIFRSGVLRF